MANKNESDLWAPKDSPVNRITAREFLATYYPDHSLHTITEITKLDSQSIEFYCDCGGLLSVPSNFWPMYGFDYKKVKEAIRNCPIGVGLI